MIDLNEFITSLIERRAAQDAQWGTTSPRQHDPLVLLAALTEEVGEVAKAVLEDQGCNSLLYELVDVAAVAAKFAEFALVKEDIDGEASSKG